MGTNEIPHLDHFIENGLEKNGYIAGDFATFLGSKFIIQRKK
jgi:hypothetical protein